MNADQREKVKSEILTFLPTSFDSQLTNETLKKAITEELTDNELDKILRYLHQLRDTGFKHVIIGINKKDEVINLETRHSIAFL